MLLDMRDDLKAVRKNIETTPQILDEIKGLREDIQPGYAMQLQAVQEVFGQSKNAWACLE